VQENTGPDEVHDRAVDLVGEGDGSGRATAALRRGNGAIGAQLRGRGKGVSQDERKGRATWTCGPWHHRAGPRKTKGRHVGAGRCFLLSSYYTRLVKDPSAQQRCWTPFGRVAGPLRAYFVSISANEHRASLRRRLSEERVAEARHRISTPRGISCTSFRRQSADSLAQMSCAAPFLRRHAGSSSNCLLATSGVTARPGSRPQSRERAL
jgi:hypothetical protein